MSEQKRGVLSFTGQTNLTKNACENSKYKRKTICTSTTTNLKFLKQLTCVCEAKALMGSRGVAVELQPQAVGCTIDDMTHHAITCKVAKETG